MQQHPQVGGSGSLQTAGFGLVGCERYVMRPYPCFPLLSHASLELSRRWSVAWYSLMTIMVIILHQSPNSRPQRPTDRKSVGPRGVVILHGRKARDGQARHMAVEPPHMVYQSCPKWLSKSRSWSVTTHSCSRPQVRSCVRASPPPQACCI